VLQQAPLFLQAADLESVAFHLAAQLLQGRSPQPLVVVLNHVAAPGLGNPEEGGVQPSRQLVVLGDGEHVVRHIQERS
jgi:hypothetical protein